MGAEDSINLRRMERRDVGAVLVIENECFPDPWIEEHFLSEIEHDGISLPLVAEADGELAGYSVAYFVEDELQIANVAVALSHRKRGIGSRIIGYLLAEAERRGDINLAFLEVRSDNYPAMSLYDKYGFVKIGKRKNYYSHGSRDAIMMMKVMEETEVPQKSES